MKKKNLITLLLIAVGSSAMAAPRSASQAHEIAAKFIAQQPKFARINSELKLTLETSVVANAKTRGAITMSTEFVPYYIYNVGAGQGYVVVSGDDTFKDVLGYSTTGNLDSENIPEGLAYMLDFYTREMEAAKTYGTTPERTAYVSESQKDVEPLIQTRWNQDDPYNLLCPITAQGKSMTGCVATGMAQTMKYYEYPERGIGSHTNANATSCSANFGETTYDWANMTNTYGNYSTDAECNAVATLMYHCGVSVNMIYSAYSSGAAGAMAAQALVNYFGYNKNIIVESRDNVSLGSWKASIFEELNAHRPVMFQGNSAASNEAAGHFFILDGYEAKTGKFHFNWGWAGMYDGYFEITALQPGAGGIGGGVGTFDYLQYIFLGVQPETTGTYVSRFDAETIRPLKYSYSRAATIQMSVSNLTHSAVNFNGKLGLGLYKDGELYMTLGMAAIQTAGYVIGTSLTSYTFASAIPLDVPDGNYQICVVAQNEGQENVDIVRAYYNNITMWNLSISGKTIELTGASNTSEISDESAPVLLTSNEGTVYVNNEALFSITVKNNGATEYYDEVGVRVYKGRTSATSQYFTVPCRLAPGESRTLTLGGIITLPEGEGYSAVACYREGDKLTDLSNKTDILVDSEANSIDSVQESDLPVVSIEYYTTSGIRIAQPESGIVIRKTLYSNGSTKTEKVKF
ncbi:MAG: C10 family peptidase [Bacteroides sp.]|nr:C10 family peptidase [Roseburia sp.]MCM1346282.1 C10 family peptidase [Bacteroides sp.]MCM1420863.1 C10 family peptidase [Bacteroides sp.]